VATLVPHEDRETDDRDAQAREEIRALFERYRMTAHRAEAELHEPASETDEGLALTGR
jgi:hypothetical protein